jgi:hypothetical protein
MRSYVMLLFLAAIMLWLIWAIDSNANIVGLFLRPPFTLIRETERAFGQRGHICETPICPVYCACF